MEWLRGGSWEEVARELGELRAGEPSPCRVAGSTVAEPLPVARRAYSLYADVNLNDPASWPSVTKLLEGISRVLEELRLGHRWLVAVSGGSEAVLTGLYIAREYTRGRVVVASSAAHASVLKAARVLGMEVKLVQVDSRLRIDLYALEKTLRGVQNVAAIVATAGVTDNGAVDPVRDVAKLAWEHGAVVYVDAAFGGLPLLGLGSTETVLPRGGPALAGIDFHKHVAPPPSSILVSNTAELRDYIVFPAPYMPLGRQETLLWTRPASGLAAAYAALRALGASGVGELARYLYRLASKLASILEQRGVELLSPLDTPLVAFRPPSVEGALKRLRRRGWILYPSRLPGILRYVAKWCHEPGDVEEIAEAVA
ncbi:aminotransferase class V-fold PLP-dependent enzyme [Hyperthermus butylicus]|uniref:Decarboxylase n=1 Tax=Hyperthermus butylicus (strain DSM 5456 / JCM 9403 / PLM1-5) TaxID=415426 RepID=A2BJD5_HYPBU|nr:aminotransferase class V-fold PLP-dependent enzyme [Hyperthermus butylicus]ABM80096.1 Decarboxylase [Hyperthermus butylicus DSM 5456]